MKKLFFCTAILVLLISSCTVTKAGIVYDESIPLEQTSWISTGQVGTITAYNGIAVKWSKYKIIQIPIGDTLLELDLEARRGDTIFTAKGVLFRYAFQPEKLYSFLFSSDENGYGLSVYAWDYGEAWATYDEKHFVEFVPFLNFGGSSSEPTILN